MSNYSKMSRLRAWLSDKIAPSLDSKTATEIMADLEASWKRPVCNTGCKEAKCVEASKS